MKYVVLDLEWNQPFTSSMMVRKPIALKGEIIQFGAVVLDDKLRILSHFSQIVCPVYYTRLQRHVKKLVQIDEAMLAKGKPFERVYCDFMDWCGCDSILLTWGYDDAPMLRDNLRLHGIDEKRLPEAYNIQLIYNAQEMEGQKNQVSLKDAMTHFGIEEEQAAHDAHTDAYHTALVCARLDIANGVLNYQKLRPPTALNDESDPWRAVYGHFETIKKGISDARLNALKCPVCGETLATKGVWTWKNNYKAIKLATCEEHGRFYLTARFSFDNTAKGYRVVRQIQPLTDELLEDYNTHKKKKKRRSRKKTLDTTAIASTESPESIESVEREPICEAE